MFLPAHFDIYYGEPIVLGMVNQENTAAGSYPELSQGAQAAIDFINEQLGGVDGRPIELEGCNTEFSAEGSTSCGPQFVEAGVPAVLGGIDVFGNAALSIYLAIALLSLKLWELAGLAGPLVSILAVQTVVIAA